MSQGYLLGLAVVAIAVLLVLVIAFKLSAFVALLLVSIGTALAGGLALDEVIPTLTAGMAKTLGSVAIIVGLGAMMGKMIEESGGAERLAAAFTGKLGVKRVIMAVTAAAFILGIPVFFDVGFIILAPIVFGFAKVAGINPLKIGLPVGIALLAVHVAVPPHPGPVAVAATLGADLGLMTILGIGCGIPMAVVGYFVSRRMNLEKVKIGASPAAAAMRGSVEEITSRPGPGAGTVLTIILIPLGLIMAGTTGALFVAQGSLAQRALSLIGAPVFALLVGVGLAYFLIGSKEKWSLTKRSSVLDSALDTVAIIIFVTGAGGVFANVLVETGVGAALSGLLIGLGMPVLLMGYVIALALRAAQGSATVALLTTAGLMVSAVEGGDFSSMQVVLIALAIGFGGFGLSHINDSGFWIVTKYLGLSVADGLKTWTLLTTICSVVGFAAVCLCWLIA